MKQVFALFIYLFLIFLALFFETSVIAVPLVLFLIITFATILEIEKVAFLAFFSGILYDLYIGEALGKSGLFYLALTFLIFLYRRKFEGEKLYFLLPLFFICYLIFGIIFYSLSLVKVIILTLISVIFQKIISYLNHYSLQDKARLIYKLKNIDNS